VFAEQPAFCCASSSACARRRTSRSSSGLRPTAIAVPTRPMSHGRRQHEIAAELRRGVIREVASCHNGRCLGGSAGHGGLAALGPADDRRSRSAQIDRVVEIRRRPVESTAARRFSAVQLGIHTNLAVGPAANAYPRTTRRLSEKVQHRHHLLPASVRGSLLSRFWPTDQLRRDRPRPEAVDRGRARAKSTRRRTECRRQAGSSSS